jgi:glycosyltransferase involved in cell wall biosynthesis
LRLLIVTQYFWPENFRVNDLAVELVRRGHEVTVLTGRPNYPGGEIFPEFKRDPSAFRTLDGVEIVRVPLWPRGKDRGVALAANFATFALSASLLGPWILRGRQFDAIFAYVPSPVTVGIPAAVLRAVKKAPLALWVLDLWPETLQAVGVVRAPWQLRLIGRLVQAIYARCDVILAQSRAFLPHIARQCRKARPIVYFPSWAEAVFSNGAETPAAEIPPAPGVFTVLFAGNIGEAQDFPAVLAAAAKLKAHDHIRWVVVGDGRMAAWVREEIARLGIGDRVLMAGRYPVERMPSFYRHADALLLCLKSEPVFALTIPGKLQSYLAAGVPVVAMVDGEAADVVTRSGSGIACAAGDSDGLARAVLQMASLPREQLVEMGARALRVSQTEFDRGRLMAELEGWFEKLRSERGLR